VFGRGGRDAGVEWVFWGRTRKINKKTALNFIFRDCPEKSLRNMNKKVKIITIIAGLLLVLTSGVFALQGYFGGVPER